MIFWFMGLTVWRKPRLFDSLNRYLSDRVSPVSTFRPRLEISNPAINSSMNMHIAFTLIVRGRTNSKTGRSWDVGTKFIVGFAASIVGGSTHYFSVPPSGNPNILDTEKCVIGWNEHGRHGNPAKMFPGFHCDGCAATWRQQPPIRFNRLDSGVFRLTGSTEGQYRHLPPGWQVQSLLENQPRTKSP